jgi:hypothetical protein
LFQLHRCSWRQRIDTYTYTDLVQSMDVSNFFLMDSVFVLWSLQFRKTNTKVERNLLVDQLLKSVMAFGDSIRRNSFGPEHDSLVAIYHSVSQCAVEE